MTSFSSDKIKKFSPSDFRIALLIVLVFFLFYFIFNHGHFTSSDEIGVFEQTKSIVERSELTVPLIHNSFLNEDGERYSQYTIGQSVLAIPFYTLGKLAIKIFPQSWQKAIAGPELIYNEMRWGGTVEIFFVGLYSAFISAILLGIFFLFQRELKVSLKASFLSTILLGVATYAAMMSTFFLQHTTVAVLILGALYFYYQWKEGGPIQHLFFGSLCVSGIFLIRFASIVAIPGLIGYLLWCLYIKSEKKWNWKEIKIFLPAVLIPLGIAIGIFVWVNYLKWGQPWFKFNNEGFSTPLYTGILGNLFSPGASIFLYSPLLLLIFWTIKSFWKEYRAETVTILGICLSFLLVFSKYVMWHGGWPAPGSRYLFILVILLMLPLGFWIDKNKSKFKWLWIGFLSVIGFIIQFLLMTINWGFAYHKLGYPDYQPQFSFLFMPEHSPIVGYIRLFFSGQAIDPWIWNLWHGWIGHPPQHLVASIIFIVWAVLFILATWLLWQNYKRRVGGQKE